jgi:hypothetical protein
MSEGDSAEHLMSALITKMESMDSNINVLKMENERLNAIVSNPQAMLKRMGMVKTTTPLAEDARDDPFRGDMMFEDNILKGEHSSLPRTNEEFHEMSWDEIHDLASTAKDNEV